ncbi:MAG: type II toxin-antitoxin system HicA family toxin [Firmicutes bacterium]|nr:type II toxin-antitoxin system HicA family toxin [Bacillota bacterium]
MKHRDLIRELESLGFVKLRSGSRHDIYHDGETAVQVPRHSEINEITAASILKKALASKRPGRPS